MTQKKHITRQDREYAAKLHGRRLELGLTLEEVQEATGISSSALSRYENAQCTPNKVNIEKLETFYRGCEAKRGAGHNSNAVERQALTQRSLEDIEYAGKLRERRRDLGLTAREVGAAIGVCHQTILGYEKAFYRPSAAKEAALETYFRGIEAKRRAATILPGALLQVREIIEKITYSVEQIAILMARAVELYYGPESEGAGADQKARAAL